LLRVGGVSRSRSVILHNADVSYIKESEASAVKSFADYNGPRGTAKVNRADATAGFVSKWHRVAAGVPWRRDTGSR